MPFGFGQETDSEETELRFWLQFTQPGLPTGVQEFVAYGRTTVLRQAWQPIEGNRFSIAAQITDMPHSGFHEQLGPFTINIDPDPAHLTVGTIEGTLDPETKQPRISPEFPAVGKFQVYLQVTTSFGTLVTGQQPVLVTNNLITTLFPDSPYTHVVELALLNLYLKGQLSRPLAKLAAGFHVKKPPPHPVWPLASRAAEPCAPPCCSVQSHGHCSCFRVTNQPGWNKQVLFMASHPGVAGSPVGRDRVLVYKTITNEGPGPITVYVDGDPPDYEVNALTTLLLPGNSLTVAAGSAVKIAYGPLPGKADDPGYARGHDVVSWCCPTSLGDQSVPPTPPAPQRRARRP